MDGTSKLETDEEKMKRCCNTNEMSVLQSELASSSKTVRWEQLAYQTYGSDCQWWWSRIKAKLGKNQAFPQKQERATYQQIRKRIVLGNQAIQVFPNYFLSQPQERGQSSYADPTPQIRTTLKTLGKPQCLQSLYCTPKSTVMLLNDQ